MSDPLALFRAKYGPLPSAHFIDGGWREPLAGDMMETFDPGRAEPYARFAAGSADDVAEAVASAAGL